MNAEQVELIRQSLIHVQPIADQIANSFYAHLFEVTPHLQNLFPGDMHKQGAMLMTSLQLAVSHLDDAESVLPAIQALGARHISYGVRVEYYPLAKEAYFWDLESHLGDQLMTDLHDALDAVYASIDQASHRET